MRSPLRFLSTVAAVDPRMNDSARPHSTTSMHEQLTRENLHGVWAAIATPFDQDDAFDEEVFRENVRRLQAAGVHGIYTTDADGEFYAIELDEFKQVVDVFADETQRLGVPSQVGVTWSNTRGILDRLRHAASRGILGAHVGHPIFMPMTVESHRAFWRDVSDAVPEWFALIHYNSKRMPNYHFGPDYATLAPEVPNLVGTKHVGSDVGEFLTLLQHAPQLSHFTGEHAMTPYMLLGARGVYSWFANFNARYMVEWYDEIAKGCWTEAKRRQERIHALITLVNETLGSAGNLHGVVGKAFSAASPFLLPANKTRRPYLRVPDDAVQRFRILVEAEFPDLIWQG